MAVQVSSEPHGEYFMTNRIKVCHGCTERHPACHDHCEKYIQAKQAWEDQKELIRENKAKDEQYSDYKRKKFKKYMRQV